MLVKTIKYKDYNGEEREENFYFNLDETEIFKMELSTSGGIQAYVNKIVSEKNGKRIIDMFEEIVLKAYGEKSLDGKYFDKSEEISNRFKHTNAYNVLMMEICTDAKRAADFINAIIPKDESNKNTPAITPVN